MPQMKITRTLQFAGLVLATAGFLSCSRNSQAPIEPIPVQIWRHGDIGSTLRLHAAIEEALRASPAFRKSNDRKPGTLIILIPASVDAVEVGDRLQLTYQVEFQTGTGSALGATTGTCWDDELSVCAGFVIKQAEIAAARIKHAPKRV
jgi:hypothetical protein